MLAASLGDVLWGTSVVVLALGWLLLFGLMLLDMFRDPTLGALAKVGWIVLMVVLPFIGIFAYLLTRGDAVGRRIGAARATNAAAELGSDRSD